MTDNLQSLITKLEREVRDLKTAQPFSLATIKFYPYTIVVQNSTEYLITYEDGDQPIVTEVYGGGIAFLGTVTNENTQKLFLHVVPTNQTIVVSTRPISSVTALN